MKEIRRLYNPLKRRSDFRLARFPAKTLIGGRASPNAEERDSVRLQKWRVVLLMVAAGPAQVPSPDLHPAIPRAWDDGEIASLEVHLANPSGSPKHVSADYYYRIPVRTIYRQSSVYYKGGTKTNA